MTFTPTNKLIHLCTDNFQEKILSQYHNKVTILKADTHSMGTNHKLKIKSASQHPVEDL